MPAMDLALIQSLGRDLHSHSPGYMGEDEVCPWTLFLTMALTLLKGQFISCLGPLGVTSGNVGGPGGVQAGSVRSIKGLGYMVEDEVCPWTREPTLLTQEAPWWCLIFFDLRNNTVFQDK